MQAKTKTLEENENASGGANPWSGTALRGILNQVSEVAEAYPAGFS
jgi:hypothetical protein